jgi:hypothetical protein
VAELVQVQPGVLLDQGAGAVVPEAHPIGFRAEVAAGGGGASGQTGLAVGAEQRPGLASVTAIARLLGVSPGWSPLCPSE